MSGRILDKRLYTDITRLKLLNKSDSQPRFALDQSPFDDDEEELVANKLEDIIIVGRIFPESEIYNRGAFQIQMKLAKAHPIDPPEVRFITPIYHPNIGKDGHFCHELLKKAGLWSRATSLTDIVRAVTRYIDHPNIDYSLSIELGREYMEHRSEFERKVMEYMKKYALPRS